MEQFDVEKLEVAIEYVNRIAEGRNPINNKKIEDSILDNPNIIRCMYFVKDVLEKVKDNNGCIGSPKSKKPEKEFPIEVLNEYVYVSDLSITKIVERFNNMRPSDEYKKISYKAISDWLKKYDFLTVIEKDGKKHTVPTEMGKRVGIYSEERTGSRGDYIACLYDEKAQKFVIKNIKDILEEQTDTNKFIIKN